MIILVNLSYESSILIKDFLEGLSKSSENKEFEKVNTELLKLLKSVSSCERSLLVSNQEIRNIPFNKFLLTIDDVFTSLNECCPYIRSALNKNFVWSTSISVLILYTGVLPIYLRNSQIIPGSSKILRPINFLLITQLVTVASYVTFVSLLNISGRASFYGLINQLAEKTRAHDARKIIEALKIPENTLLFDHLTKNNKLFAPLLEYYANPNFVANFTMENVNEFPMVNIPIEDDIELYPTYQHFNTSSGEINKSMVSFPLLVQVVILFGPLPRPLKVGAHLLILSNRGLKFGRRFFNARKTAKIEKARENLINQFS